MDVYVAALIVTGSSVLCGMFLVNETHKQPH
jgi:hypothetical protein